MADESASESMRAAKRITITIESDLAEWIEKEASLKRLPEAVFVRMTVAAVRDAAEKSGGGE